MLLAANYQLVSPGDISAFTFCGARALGAERAFVAFDQGTTAGRKRGDPRGPD
jgi:hypothetical protein